MRFENAYIPYKAYWSSPFCRWQGSFANLHPMRFAAEVTNRAMEERKLNPEDFDELLLGMTVPAPSSFYGAPWLAGLIGAEMITGPMISQACATSARVIFTAAGSVNLAHNNGGSRAILSITTDRTSNGPHLTYPNPLGPGGKMDVEDWVWDNFNLDPYARNSMLETAENVAQEEEITTEEQHEVVILRHEQYQAALEEDSAFLKRFMITPVDVNPSGKKVISTVEGDEGVFPTTKEKLEKLRPVMPEGTVTFGGQTYPADGNAGMVVADQSTAARMSGDKKIEIRLISAAEGRAKKGFMPQANLPAAGQALKDAGIGVDDLRAIKTHNPFAVNDICLSRGLGIELERMNNYGSSLIWGHPQGPTGMRLVIELIEELVLRGGGYGLFTGCAAGDTAAAIVVQVGEV
jgi:acetyl-CoA acetyltransferase